MDAVVQELRAAQLAVALDRLKEMNDEALAYKQGAGQGTRVFLEQLRAKQEAVICAAPSDSKINVQLRTMEE